MPEDFNDIQSAIQTIKGIEDGSIDPNEINLPDDENTVDEDIDNPVDKPVDNEDKTDDTEVKPEDDTEKTEESEDETDKQDDEPKTQTPEENRKFAEQRRQQELEKRVQEELSKNPELQAAKLLQDQYGLDLNTILQEVQLEQLKEQSQQTGIPLEVLQRQSQLEQQTTASNQRLAELEFKLWQSEVRLEAQDVQKDYPMLTADDMQEAVTYMVDTLGTTNIPLKNVVMAVHGDKIMESLRTQARNEVLAEKSGRKTPLQPQGGKSPSTPTISEEERYVAKMMGVSEEDYLKYK
jgi:hypothetical protein